MKRTIKDFIFEKSLLFLALLTLAGLAGIVWFLFKEGMPVLETISLKHFLTGHDWYPTEDPPSFGIFPLIIGSVSVTLLAAVMAIPLGILCAVYLSEIASSRLPGRTHQKLSNEPRYRSPFIGDLTRGTF